MNEDLNKQFALKNSEIFKNKLIIDINNNNESLVISLHNMLNMMFDDAKLKLQEIFESILYRENIDLYISEIKNKFLIKIDSLVLFKKDNLLEFINNLSIDSMESGLYQDKIKELNEQIFLEIDNLYKDELDDIKIKIEELENNQFLNDRYNDFYQRFKNLLIDKIKMQFFDRDNNLVNNYRESYKKYIDINKITIDR
jgi:hypothetical protein